LERYALTRASSTLERLLARAPRVAFRLEGEQLQQIDVSAVQIGDRLIVRPGDLVPVDGTLESEFATVDESALTGEPLSASKRQGATVVSGSVNAGGVFTMRADHISTDSQYAKIVQLVREAQADRPPIQRLADQYAVWFTPLALAMSAFGWWLTGDPRTALAVLVVATPCPLILATPIAIISGINRAAGMSIIIKGGAALERIGLARSVVFDKTGTLTAGTPTVEQVLALDGISASELLLRAASVEQLSSHLLGQMLTRAAHEQGGALALPSDFREFAGRGVEGALGQQRIVVGSPRFLMERLNLSALPPDVDSRLQARGPGALATLIGVDDQLAGIVQFRDRLRPGVPPLVSRLRALGVERVVMLTGDSAENARTIACEAGITEVEANVLPAGKVAVVQALKQRSGPVVMVGDGINDAPALATADVGIAMGAHGTAISAEAADIVLLVDDIARVGDALVVGQRTLRIAKQSIIVGLGLSGLLMVIASTGAIPPAVGALCQEAVDVAVILNALRAR
jgi:heavy metal translocating P-type ATPase